MKNTDKPQNLNVNFDSHKEHFRKFFWFWLIFTVGLIIGEWIIDALFYLPRDPWIKEFLEDILVGWFMALFLSAGGFQFKKGRK